MAAVLASGIAVGGEGRSAVDAGELVQSLGCRFYEVQVGVPPFLATCLAAEELFLPFGDLVDRLAALLAAGFLVWFGWSGRSFPLGPQAEGFHRSFPQGQRGGDMPVAAAHPAHLEGLFFLVLCHVGLLPYAGKPYPCGTARLGLRKIAVCLQSRHFDF